jgi:hypothetical protein
MFMFSGYFECALKVSAQKNGLKTKSIFQAIQMLSYCNYDSQVEF